MRQTESYFPIKRRQLYLSRYSCRSRAPPYSVYTQIVLRRKPCVITVASDFHGRRERGNMALFQVRSNGIEFYIQNFRHTESYTYAAHGE